MAASALGRTAAPFAPRVSPRSPAPASAARAKKRPAEEIRRAGNFDELLRRHPRQDRRQAQAPAGGSAIARSPRRWGAAVLATPERPHTRFSGHRRRSETTRDTPAVAWPAGWPARKITQNKAAFRARVAEREGFEPSVPARGTTVFETAPFDRSGTSPVNGYYYLAQPCR